MFDNYGLKNSEAEGYSADMYWLLLAASTGYLALLSYYSVLAVKRPLPRFRETNFVIFLVMYTITSALIVLPYTSVTLKFINWNGVVNLCLVLTAFLFEPHLEQDIIRYEDEVVEYETDLHFESSTYETPRALI